GLIVLGLKSWEGGKLRLRNVLVWGISLFVTLINPIGWNLWLGALSFSAEISTKLFIEELTPTLFVLDPVWIFYAAFSVALIWRFRADLDLWQKFVLMGFFLQGLFTVRYLIFWVILSLPFVIGSLKHFRREVRDRGVLSQRRFGVAIKGLMVWVLLLMVVRMFVFRPVSIEMSEDYYYPKLAVGYLRTYPSEGQYFSDFAWGGYLVWKLPEKKVFINGSMATLRRKESPEGETKAAFGDYIKLLRGELEVSKVFEKYNVDTFLWRTPKERKQDLTFVSLPDWLTGKLEEKKSKTLLEEVESLGWKEVYRDEVAVIYRKPE
ncbi:MAG: putative membrane protein, partial [Candidatus Nomurabacteria bacterium GW2011_GWA1_46_11]